MPAVAVRRLYDGEGWWPSRSVAEINAVLAASPAVGAWHAGELVGFARAVIDTNLRAYLEDVVVDRAHRRRGVATAILERLLSELGATHLVSLFTGGGGLRFPAPRPPAPCVQQAVRGGGDEGDRHEVDPRSIRQAHHRAGCCRRVAAADEGPHDSHPLPRGGLVVSPPRTHGSFPVRSTGQPCLAACTASHSRYSRGAGSGAPRPASRRRRSSGWSRSACGSVTGRR